MNRGREGELETSDKGEPERWWRGDRRRGRKSKGMEKSRHGIGKKSIWKLKGSGKWMEKRWVGVN